MEDGGDGGILGSIPDGFGRNHQQRLQAHDAAIARVETRLRERLER